MRLAPWAVLLLLSAGVAAACSAFIPFDEYAGPVTGSPGDAAIDGPPGTGPDAASPSCKDADLKTDPNNCGACGRVCACNAGLCPVELLNEGTGNVTALHLGVHDGDAGSADLYFARSTGVLARVDLDGGRYEEAAVSGVGPLGFGTSNGLVGTKADGIDLFTRDRFLDAGPTHIVSPRDKLGPMLYESSYVYFSDADGMYYARSQYDAAVSTLADASAVAITSYAGISYWTDATGLILRMATQSPGFLAPVLAKNESDVTDIAANKGHLYLTQRSQGLVVYDYDNTTAKLVHLAPVADAELLAADDAHVYVYNAAPAAGKRQLLRFDADGTSQLVLAETLTSVRALAIDATYLYFTDQAKLLRIPK